MPTITRRNFLKIGCSAAIAAMVGSRFNTLVFGSPLDEPNQNILVVIFLRGGSDVLSILPPLEGDDRSYYEDARPELKIPVAELLPLGSHPFGLHPTASALHDLYNAGDLAIVQAAGMYSDTRSHFDAQAYMERGAPDQILPSTGWLTRHIETAPFTIAPDELGTVALASALPASFASDPDAIALNSFSTFDINTGEYRWRSALKASLRQMYESGTSPSHVSGVNALDAVDIVTANFSGDYTPEPGVVYPDNSFGDHLMMVARIVKQQVGLRTAALDLGGWDTHQGQGSGSSGYFADLLGVLSDGLGALYADLNTSQTDYTERVTIAVMSEFGRRFVENANSGTDHGHGGMMLVLGGQTNGGLHGVWPGLHTDQLYNGKDLEVTTDYRQVLSEIIIRQFENDHIDYVFPNYTGYSPLGVIRSIPQTPATQISKVGNDVEISWGHIAQDTDGRAVDIDRYDVWRSATPYFDPVAEGMDPIASIIPPEGTGGGDPIVFTDSGVANLVGSYFYTVRAVGVDGQVSEFTMETGKFTYELVSA
jgi:uncharacterized protein (DUF1501 family)